MGVTRGVGIDVDSSAISEASQNVALNHLSERIEITSQPFETIEASFDLIMANLRWPTLKAYLPQMVTRMNAEAALLLSGIEKEESPAFLEQALGLDLDLQWQDEELGWAAICLQRSMNHDAKAFLD